MSKEEEHTLLLKIVSQLEKVNSEVACWRIIFEQASSLIKVSEEHEKRIKDMEKSKIPLALASAVSGGLLSHLIKFLS